MSDDGMTTGQDDLGQDDLEADARDAAAFDEQPFDELHGALAGMSHLDPARADAPADAAMPDWAWDRISTAIAAEAASRAATTHDNVVLLPTAAAVPTEAAAESIPVADAATATRTGRHSRASRWGGGLVAASVTLIAVGVGYSALHGSPPRPVAANKIAPAAAATLGGSSPSATPASAQAFAAEAAAPSAADSLAAGAAPPMATSDPSTMALPSAPSVQTRSTVVQAARMVTDTGTDYQKEQLTDQVTSLLDTVGVHDAGDVALLPSATALPTDPGFTASWVTLRDCITWLTSDANSQALVVDRGTYEGSDAGVVVAPATDAVAPTSPPPTMSIDTAEGQLKVWVIDPSCKHVESSIEDQALLQLQP